MTGQEMLTGMFICYRGSSEVRPSDVLGSLAGRKPHLPLLSRPGYHGVPRERRRDSHMSAKENKATARRFMEESFGGGKPELVDDVLDPDFVRYDPYIESGEVRGAQTVKGNIEWFRNAFPDLSCTVEEQVAESDKVVSRWTVRGTHRGDFLGVAGTGNRVEFTGMQIDRFDESGKIVEERAEFDLLGAMRQMGAVPKPYKTGSSLIRVRSLRHRMCGYRLGTRRTHPGRRQVLEALERISAVIGYSFSSFTSGFE